MNIFLLLLCGMDIFFFFFLAACDRAVHAREKAVGEKSVVVKLVGEKSVVVRLVSARSCCVQATNTTPNDIATDSQLIG